MGGVRDASTHPDSTIGPGVCPVQIDSGTDDGSIQDTGVVDSALYDATIGPGQCPFIPDAGDPEDGGMPPGIC